ncbi:hypothetical protein NQ315_006706 [Exocentrus adspersus]|uniref:beta-glucosidase n=1 Tax=Exocentrus adspersus TaxID=1586481 RepID=A0AAV8WD25_9CUCU|nr:hypothetical protein NQ315_006706 [Exocentrus adspersus]
MKLVFVLVSSLCLLSKADEISNRRFPDDFLIGVASASYQIEGAWNEDGKGENIWDRFTHEDPSRIVDKSNGDIACDSYHLYKEDVALIKAVGLDFYRFSISWSRILPTGYADSVNIAGVNYYKNLIKELKDNGIEPMPALYHWDLPQPLQEIGGWLNETIVDIFADYAKLCYQLFGDDIKTWFTINEPRQVCLGGYEGGGGPPGIRSPGVGVYNCAYNLIKAHAKAFHIYDDEFRPKQNGRISMIIDETWYEPGSDSDADKEAAERDILFIFGLYADPIFKGNWPQVVIDRIAMRSKGEGLEKSRLPEFTPEEQTYIAGTADFLALNHYTTHMVNASTVEPEFGGPSFGKDINVIEWDLDNWETAGAGWFKIVPWGLRKLLVWLYNYYQTEIFVTENGLSDNNGTMTDDHRIKFLQTYLTALLQAIYEDGVNVTGYTYWSIIDDWEWTGGYTSKMGFYAVDFNSTERTRTPRKSADYFTNVMKTRCLVDSCV